MWYSSSSPSASVIVPLSSSDDCVFSDLVSQIFCCDLSVISMFRLMSSGRSPPSGEVSVDMDWQGEGLDVEKGREVFVSGDDCDVLVEVKGREGQKEFVKGEEGLNDSWKGEGKIFVTGKGEGR